MKRNSRSNKITIGSPHYSGAIITPLSAYKPQGKSQDIDNAKTAKRLAEGIDHGIVEMLKHSKYSFRFMLLNSTYL